MTIHQMCIFRFFMKIECVCTGGTSGAETLGLNRSAADTNKMFLPLRKLKMMFCPFRRVTKLQRGSIEQTHRIYIYKYGYISFRRRSINPFIKVDFFLRPYLVCVFWCFVAVEEREDKGERTEALRVNMNMIYHCFMFVSLSDRFLRCNDFRRSGHISI
jgi:hypothetical protein